MANDTTKGDDVAVVGFSFRLPEDVDTAAGFWRVLEKRQNLMGEWPRDRADIAGHQSVWHPLGHSGGGHFVRRDVGAFDSSFFSVTAREAACMDPLQRWTLEAAYLAFEQAGFTMDGLKGSSTAVFSASFTEDYARMVGMDPDNVERTAATGTMASIVPNRVSWFFDLHGPSVHVDSACSSGLAALDMACKTLRIGDAECALVTASNLMLDPAVTQLFRNLNMLGPDSVCRSFDHGANGYGRGEGVLALVVKPVAAAVRDGDMIRAVIRGIASNQDGRTPTLSQPSPTAQETLIRRVYKDAGLDMSRTAFVEAHGTGTPVGDPIEMEAIGRAFRESRLPSSPLYVGSVKSNIGHLEGASGLAGVVKAIVMLEKGMIAPNALFRKMNPAIDAEYLRVRVPTEMMAWPSSGLRQISVTAFGFGGSNTHVVLCDALHYLTERGLSGHHCTVADPHGKLTTNRESTPRDYVRLLVFSARDEKANARTVDGYMTYIGDAVSDDAEKVDRLAFTLAARRNHMRWRSFAVVDQPGLLSISKPVRSSDHVLAAFVFTGQGAQYANMGRGLMQYPVFADVLKRVDGVYKRLMCGWSVLDQLGCAENIDEPEYSQPLSTAIQLGLVELLKSFGVVPTAVVGHSSGEIAAAYCTGALDLKSACKVSYFRGLLAGRLKSHCPGAMVTIDLAPDDVDEYLQNKVKPTLKPGGDMSRLCTACINSPYNCTLSGPENLVDAVQKRAEQDGVFAKKLKTGLAYHSPAMLAMADEYRTLMGTLEPSADGVKCPMISSVTGKPVDANVLVSPGYWVDNLVSPVRFSQALASLKAQHAHVTDVIEVGPHAALRRYVKDAQIQARYGAVLLRDRPAMVTLLELAGSLYCHGHPVDITSVNGLSIGPFIVDAPEYPFDRTSHHWSESRLSRQYRLRRPVVGDLLGMQASDWNVSEPRWRSFLSVETTPWVGHHVVSDTVLYPAAGLLLMAVEAVQQMVAAAHRTAVAYLVKEAHFTAPVVVGKAWEDRCEVTVQLRPLKKAYEKEATRFAVTTFCYVDGNDAAEVFDALVQVQYDDAARVDGGQEKMLADEAMRGGLAEAIDDCQRPVDSLVFYGDANECGLQFGDTFRLLQDIQYDGTGMATARVDVSKAKLKTRSLVHPAVLDAAFHVLRAAAGSPASANIPMRMSEVWLAASGWQQTKAIRWAAWLDKTKSQQVGERGRLCGLAEDGTVLCTVQEAVTRAVAKHDKDVEGPRMHVVEWKPQLSLLSPNQLTAFCHAGFAFKDETVTLANFRKLVSVLELVGARTLDCVPLSQRSNLPGVLGKHLAWLDKHINALPTRPDVTSLTDADISARLEEVESLLPAWKLYTSVARQVPSLLAGHVDPLHVIFESDLANKLYAGVFATVCGDDRFARFINLAAHETPGLRILEVGAGTGGLTGHVLGALRTCEKVTGIKCFSEYVFTDLSPAFLEPARLQFEEFAGRMRFQTLDISDENGLEKSGLKPGSYDLVIAGSVVHATACLSRSLATLHRALKLGGRLVLLEAVNTSDIATSYVFSMAPGWWVAEEPWRAEKLSPLLSEEEWKMCLREAGFSGNDMVLRDHQTEECHVVSMIVTEKIEIKLYQPVEKRMVFLIAETRWSNWSRQEEEACSTVAVRGSDPDEEDDEFTNLIRQLDCHRRQIRTISLAEAAERSFTADDVVISFLEVRNSLLIQPSTKRFHQLQALLGRAKNLLWVAGPSRDGMPHHGVALGFLRTMRAEVPDSTIVSLVLESSAMSADFISEVFESAFSTSRSCGRDLELEYVVRHGLLTTGRAVVDLVGKAAASSMLHSQLGHVAWKDGPSLKVSVSTPGTLDSLHFVHDPLPTELDPHDVEIEAKAWGLNFRDVLTALGRLDADQLGADCAGVVTRVGPACTTGLAPGDRVCLMASGSMRKYPRCHESTVLKLPHAMAFDTVASLLVPAMTAYHALVDVGRLTSGETVLVHSAAGATGQMAVRISQLRGAQVFATTSSPEKRDFLVRELGVPDDHIFHSRTTSFAQGIQRMTHGRGVDVVLNSLSGDGLRASWECLAKGGRFVDIGRADIEAHADLPMKGFARNATFSAVELTQLNRAVIRRLLKKTLKMVVNGTLSPPQPLHVFGASRLEEAFRFLQNGSSIGRIVIVPGAEDVVPQVTLGHRALNPYHFPPDASYVIAGGFGGLGRSIIGWMADRGAKHLIVLSRSGPTTPSALDLVARLQGRGIQVLSPSCDVASMLSLSAVLDHCAAIMPPVRGCINACAVLHDAVFASMTHFQWLAATRNKVDTSWNLHQLLPSNLDFFILLSSLAGVNGQMASSNYAAGCTFQDALARHRLANGQSALSIDLGWVRGVGMVAETRAFQRQRFVANDMESVREDELLAVMHLACDPKAKCGLHGQLLLGLRTVDFFRARNQTPPPLLERPVHAGFAHAGVSVETLSSSSSPSSNSDKANHADLATQFRHTDDADLGKEIFMAALSAKLASAMAVATEDVEPGRSLSDYGADSLMAVELMNWIWRDFGVRVAVWEIMGGKSLGKVVDLVVGRRGSGAVADGDGD